MPPADDGDTGAGTVRRIPGWIRGWIRGSDPWVTAAWAAVVVPIVVAAVRAVANHWLPIGDNALFQIRARDVGTSHHPWLGTWSSASVDAGRDLNHPGPILFDLLALPVRVFGGRAGVALGTAAVNVVAVTLVAVMARRAGGRGGALAALAATAWMAYTMGSELLFDPWNPHVLILPCCAMLVAAWATAVGARGGLPVLLGVASFCLQVHLSYATLVVGLPLVALGVRLALGRRDGHGGATTLRRTVRPASWIVLAVLWAQPLWDQFFRDGNLLALASAGGGDGQRVGGSLGMRIAGAVWWQPPWSARSRFIDAIPITFYGPDGTLSSVPVTRVVPALGLLGLVAVAVGLCIRLAWRRGDRPAFTLLAVLVGAELVGIATVVIMPLGALGLSPHQMRWLWPISAFTVAACAFTVWRAIPHHRSPLATRSAVALAVALGLLTLPTYSQPAGPNTRADLMPALRDLTAQLDEVDGLGLVWFDSSTVPLLDNAAATVLASLRERGVEFVVDEPGLVRQFGNARRLDGHADTWMQMAYGDDVADPPEGFRVVAVAGGIAVLVRPFSDRTAP